MKLIITLIGLLAMSLTAQAGKLTEAEALQKIDQLVPVGSNLITLKGTSGHKECIIEMSNGEFGAEVNYHENRADGSLDSRTLFKFQTALGRTFVSASSSSTTFFVKYFRKADNQLDSNSFETLTVVKINESIRSIKISDRDGANTCSF